MSGVKIARKAVNFFLSRFFKHLGYGKRLVEGSEWMVRKMLNLPTATA